MATVLFYNFIVLSSTFFVWLSEKGRTYVDRWVLLWIAFLIVFVPSAIRYGVGADFFSYLNIYENLENYTWMEQGFYFVNWALRSIEAHPQWSFSVFALLFSFAAFKAYPKNGAWIIHLIFFSMFYLISFFYIRQAIAVGFSLWALYLFTIGKTYRFLILIIIASLFHKSAIVIIFIGLLSLIPLKDFVKSYVFPVLALIIMGLSLFKLSFVLGSVESALNLIGMTKYANYFNSVRWMETRNLGTGLGVLYKILFCLYIIFNTKYFIRENERYWFVVLSVFLYAFGLILSAQIVIFGRLAYLFIFSIPFAGYILYKQRKRKTINLIVIFMFVLLSIMSLTKDGMDLGGQWGESLLLNPYKTIFTE